MGGVRWNERQYQDYMRRQQEPAQKEERKAKLMRLPSVPPGTLMFEIPMELSPLTNGSNGLDRMHWRNKKKLKERLACLLRSQAPLDVALPFAKAKVEVIRYSSSEPDRDNMHGALKPLLDAMQVASKRHPYGAYIIENDSSEHIELVVRWEKAPPKMGKVVVLVTPIGG